MIAVFAARCRIEALVCRRGAYHRCVLSVARGFVSRFVTDFYDVVLNVVAYQLYLGNETHSRRPGEDAGCSAQFSEGRKGGIKAYIYMAGMFAESG